MAAIAPLCNRSLSETEWADFEDILAKWTTKLAEDEMAWLGGQATGSDLQNLSKVQKNPHIMENMFHHSHPQKGRGERHHKLETYQPAKYHV